MFEYLIPCERLRKEYGDKVITVQGSFYLMKKPTKPINISAFDCEFKYDTNEFSLELEEMQWQNIKNYEHWFNTDKLKEGIKIRATIKGTVSKDTLSCLKDCEVVEIEIRSLEYHFKAGFNAPVDQLSREFLEPYVNQEKEITGTFIKMKDWGKRYTTNIIADLCWFYNEQINRDCELGHMEWQNIENYNEYAPIATGSMVTVIGTVNKYPRYDEVLQKNVESIGLKKCRIIKVNSISTK